MKLVQGWWTQFVDKPADVADQGGILLLDFLQCSLCRFGVIGQQIDGSIQVECLGCQCWTQSVVKIASNTPAFFLAGENQALPCMLQRPSELH